MTKLPSILAEPWALSLLLAMPFLSLLQLVAAWRGRRSLLKLGQPVALAGLMPAPRRWRWLASLLFSTGVTALLVGAAAPQWGRDPHPAVVAGRDVVILLDMSNSMRATDAPPDRFHRAVASASDLVAHVRTRGGHRLGLVAFAGEARIVCPLTYDYDLFQTKLSALDMDHPPAGIRPASGTKSGTRFGAGMKAAVSVFDPSTRGFQDVVFLSDGDDPVNDGEWELGLREVANAGVTFYTVGIGDPSKDSALAIAGLEVKAETHLHEGPLTTIARQTGGSYLPARLEMPALADFFQKRIEPKGETTPQADPPPLLKPRQVWFYAGALGMFGLSWLFQLRRADIRVAVSWLRRRQPKRMTGVSQRLEKVRRRFFGAETKAGANEESENSGAKTPRRQFAALLILLLFPLAAAEPTTPEDWERLADAAFDAGRFEEAAHYYILAGRRSAEPGRLAYNAAIACFNQGRYREAERLFRCDLESADLQRRGRALYNLGACLLQASEGRDPVRLGEAINCFSQCLSMSDANQTVRADAQYNMELAKQLWRRIRDDVPPPDKEPPNREDSDRPDQPDKSNDNNAEDRTGNLARDRQRRQGLVPANSDGSEAGRTDNQSSPAPGSMSPLTDAEQLKPLSPREARELLKLAGERIARERRALQHSSAGEMKSYPDW